MTTATIADVEPATGHRETTAAAGGRPGTDLAGHATVTGLLRERAGLPADHPYRAVLRTRAIEAALPLAHRLAVRFQGRGEPVDDLYQSAAVALVNAVDRYDPARQVGFTAYAVPTILGALKRHFRDTTWRVRVPRKVQELAITLPSARAALTQQLGRSPTRRELAAYLRTTEEDLTTATIAWEGYCPESLDAPSATGTSEPRRLIDTIGTIDAGFDAVNDRLALQSLLAALPARQRRILAMRYFAELTQAEIAAQVGLSQMHVSRLLAHALTCLRTGLLVKPSPRRIAGA